MTRGLAQHAFLVVTRLLLVAMHVDIAMTAPVSGKAPRGTDAARMDVPVPRPGTPSYFEDWAAGCDNVLRCQAVSLLPSDASLDDPVVLEVVREGGGAGVERN